MSVKKYAIIILSILVIAFIISRIPSCKTTVSVVDIEKQSMQKAIDSMHLKMQNLDWENHILVVKLAESKANVQVINKTKEVVIHDTISKIVNIPQFFRDTQYITLTPNSKPETHNSKLLRLPAEFNIKDNHIGLTGTIDTLGITLQRIAITNRITLKDDVKKSFFTEKHSFSVTQSNPYISSVIPVYLYQKPTRRGLFLEKMGCVAIGFGIGYAASEFKIFKK